MQSGKKEDHDTINGINNGYYQPSSVEFRLANPPEVVFNWGESACPVKCEAYFSGVCVWPAAATCRGVVS